MSSLPRILLVEDDRNIAGALAQALRNIYEIDIAPGGKQALYKSDTGDYKLVILDLNLPDMPGSIICQQLRERGFTSPILILSGESHVLTKINLLDMGANDYLTKPFSLGELKARLRAQLRTPAMPLPAARELSAGGITLDRLTYCVKRGGTEIRLRRKEFNLLECLMEHAGSVVTRQALMRHVWPGSDEFWTNTVDVHVKHLRDKIDRPFGQNLIRTVHGVGYKIEAPAVTTAGK
jgi:two-component system OmpR family response regulator